MGRHHADGWKRAGHEVVSVTDIDTNRANSLARDFGIKRVYGNYRDALDDKETEIIAICLPLSFHAEIAVEAAKRSKHIFCEKPMAGSFEESLSVEKAVHEAGVQYGLGFQRNLSKGVLKAQELVQSGRLGRPVVFHCDSVMEIRPKRIMHDADGNMGPVMDLGCHYYTMWNSVFQSQPKTVHAIGKVLAKDRTELSHIPRLAVDSAIVTVEYESGDVGLFTVTWGMPPRFKMKSAVDRIYGPKGGLEGYFNHNTDHLAFFEEDGEEEIELDVYPSLHEEQFRLFTEALDAGEPAPVGIREGQAALALTLSIFQSIETGLAVDFPAFREELEKEPAR